MIEKIDSEKVINELRPKIQNILNKQYYGTKINNIEVVKPEDGGTDKEDEISIGIDLNIDVEEEATDVSVVNGDVDSKDLDIYAPEDLIEEYEITKIEDELKKITLEDLDLIDVYKDVYESFLSDSPYEVYGVDSGFAPDQVDNDYADVTYYIAAGVYFILTFRNSNEEKVTNELRLEDPEYTEKEITEDIEGTEEDNSDSIKNRLKEAEEYLVKNVLNHSYIDITGAGQFEDEYSDNEPNLKIEVSYDITDEVSEDPWSNDFNSNVGSPVRISDEWAGDAASWINKDIEKSDFKQKFPDLGVECYGAGVESDMQVSYVKHHNYGYYEEPETEVEFDGFANAFVDIYIWKKEEVSEGIDKETNWTRNVGYVDPRTNFKKLRPEVQAKVINGMTWADRKAHQEWAKEHQNGYCPNCHLLIPAGTGVCDNCGYKVPDNPVKSKRAKISSVQEDALEKLKKNLGDKEYLIFSNAMKNVTEKDKSINLFQFAKELGSKLNYEPKKCVEVLNKIAQLNGKKSDLLNATFNVEYKKTKTGLNLPYKLSLT